MEDCVRKGRSLKGHVRTQVIQARIKRGSQLPFAKLTEDIVLAIRASSEKIQILADRYGVSDTLISYVRHRKIWKHVR
jgi:hypothetical protein